MSLNLNYRPEPVADITTLTEQQWLDLRRSGIGGSDVAAALNASPYRTARELYHDKISTKQFHPSSSKNVTFQIGHLLEDVVADVFADKTGFEVYEDHTMYRHPLFPFLIADVDRFIRLPNGEKAILECKTAHYDMKHCWANDAIPRHYEMQVRHYLSVMNLKTAYIACLFSNNDNDFVWRKVTRDEDGEEMMILQLQDFWNNYVLARKEPPLVEKPDLALKALRRLSGPPSDSNEVVDLDADFGVNLKKIIEKRQEKREIDAKSRELEQEIKKLYVPIVAEMGNICRASCADGDDVYTVSYHPQYRVLVNKDDLSRLKAQHPDLYKEYASTSESRIFRVSIVQPKKSKNQVVSC